MQLSRAKVVIPHMAGPRDWSTVGQVCRLPNGSQTTGIQRLGSAPDGTAERHAGPETRPGTNPLLISTGARTSEILYLGRGQSSHESLVAPLPGDRPPDAMGALTVLSVSRNSTIRTKGHSARRHRSM